MDYDEKLAATLVRYRASMTRLKNSRPSTKMLHSQPQQPQPKVAVVEVECAKCTAHTLEGRKCTFRATYGNFCRKHFLMK
jgi:hypothetical protein